MIFSASLTLGLSSLFLGCAFGCAVCMASAKISGRKCLDCRLSLMLVFASLYVLSVAAFVLFVQKRFGIRLVLSSASDVAFLFGLFAFGILLSSMWKFVLVPAIVCYLALSFYTSKSVYERFSDFPSDLPLSLDSSSVVVKIRVYRMPPKLLVPVGRFFYELEVKSAGGDGASSGESPVLEKKSGFGGWIFGDFEESFLEIPDAKVYPALFKLNFNSGFDSFDVSLTRTL